jgi:hypothetical protein
MQSALRRDLDRELAKIRGFGPVTSALVRERLGKV